MKILSKMLSKKIDPQEPIDLDEEELRPIADDTGQINASRSRDPQLNPQRSVRARDEEPEVAASGWASDDWEDDWDDDDDWGDDEFDEDARRVSEDKQHLVSEIRDAMVSVSQSFPEAKPAAPVQTGNDDWSDDEEFGRRARARSQLTAATDDAEDRILEKTEDVMSDRETSRRRSAMAHMKAAAAATKADRVLRHVSREPSDDTEEQSPYRDDLAKVVRPHSKSRPISRQVSRPNAPSPIWDQGEGDEDAALFAAAEDGLQDDPAASVESELSAAEAERLARTPAALSEEDFADDFPGERVEPNDFPASRFAEPSVESSASAFQDISEDDFEDDFSDDLDDLADDDGFDFDDEDDFAPRPSRAVSEAVAFANAPDDELEQPEEEVRKKIWEMADEVATEVENVRRSQMIEAPDVAIENIADVTAVVPGRSGAGRVKTRLLGFQAEDQTKDVFQNATAKREAPVTRHTMFPVGWLMVLEGPGYGACFTLVAGVSQIGRGEGQDVRLDFGDTSISRQNHAAVAYDDEQNKFFLGHGGKSNMVRKNGMPVLSTEELVEGDEIRIGETLLKFVALCGDDFSWSGENPADE